MNGGSITGTLAFLGNVNSGEMMVIFIVALLLFGAKKLPEIARSLGRSLEEFRRSAREVRDEFMNSASDTGPTPTSPPPPSPAETGSGAPDSAPAAEAGGSEGADVGSAPEYGYEEAGAGGLHEGDLPPVSDGAAGATAVIPEGGAEAPAEPGSSVPETAAPETGVPAPEIAGEPPVPASVSATAEDKTPPHGHLEEGSGI